MDWKELINPTKWKIILLGAIFVLFVIYSIFILPLQDIPNAETARANAYGQCTKFTESQCAQIVTFDSCQFTCTFDQALNRCTTTIPGTPLPTAPAGTTC